MIKCRSCGQENIDGALDCESCGVHLETAPMHGLSGRIEKGTISDLRPREAIIVSASATLAEAITTMRDFKFGCVLTVENDKITGILTERDLLFGVAGAKDPKEMMVSDIMHKNPVFLSPDDPISFAFHHMAVGGYRHLPVYEKDKPVGIISSRDLLRFLTVAPDDA